MVTSTLTDVEAPLLNTSVTVKNGGRAIEILRGRKRDEGATVVIYVCCFCFCAKSRNVIFKPEKIRNLIKARNIREEQ